MDDAVKNADEIEKWLVRRIAVALEIDAASVDRTEPLLALGLDSLALFTITGELAEWLDRELPAMLLWDAPTIAAAAHAIADSIVQGPAPAGGRVTAAAQQHEAPLTYQQARLWRHAARPPAADHNVIVRRWVVRGAIDLAALDRALVELAARHEILRTTFEDRDTGPVQVVRAPGVVQRETLDVRASADPPAEADRLMREEQQRPMHLDAGPLVRLVTIRVGEREWRVVLALHHLLIDAFSFPVFYDELAQHYAAALAGAAAALPPPMMQVADVARWQREQLAPGGIRYRELLSWWTDGLRPPLPRMTLPLERRAGIARPDPPVEAFKWVLTGERLDALRGLAQREHTTLFAVHLTALAALLVELTGEPDVVVGTYVSERHSSTLSRTIGCFVNLVPLRIAVDRSATFLALLRATHLVTRSASAHQDMPFDELCAALEAAGRPAPAISVIYEHSRSLPRTLELVGTEIELVRGRESAQEGWGVSISTQELPSRLVAVMSFDGARYEPAAMAGLMARYLAITEAMLDRPGALLAEWLGVTKGAAPGTV